MPIINYNGGVISDDGTSRIAHTHSGSTQEPTTKGFAMSRSTTLKITNAHAATLSSYIAHSGNGVIIRHRGQWRALVSLDGHHATLDWDDCHEVVDIKTCTIHRTTLEQVGTELDKFVEWDRVDMEMAHELARREDEHGPVRLMLEPSQVKNVMRQHGEAWLAIRYSWLFCNGKRVARFNQNHQADAGVILRYLGY